MHNIVSGFYEDAEERRLHMKQELSADIQNENTAPVIAQKLYEALCSYQESLPDEDDMVLAVQPNRVLRRGQFRQTAETDTTYKSTGFSFKCATKGDSRSSKTSNWFSD